MSFTSRIVKLPDLPMVTERTQEYLSQCASGSTKSFGAIREEFILDIATLHGRTLAQVAHVVEKLRTTVHQFPSEFTAEAKDYLDRIYAAAVAARLLGGIK